jgi:uncharacterized protein YceH (UPF0502 family)
MKSIVMSSQLRRSSGIPCLSQTQDIRGNQPGDIERRLKALEDQIVQLRAEIQRLRNEL